MLYIVRTGPPYFDVFLKQLIKAIPSQSVIYDTGDNFNLLQNNLRYSPVFGKYYLIVMNYTKDKELFKFLEWATVTVKYIKVVLYVKSKSDFITAQQRSDMNKIPYKVYDNYKASSRDRDLYITNYLSKYDIVLKPDVLKAIRGRLHGYSIEVNSLLEKIARLEKITPVTVRKAIPPRSNLNYASFGYILFSEDYTVEDFHKLLFEYKYSPKILYNSVYDYHNKLMKLYKLYLTGVFSEINYKTFVLEKGDKYGINNEYHAQGILDIFSRYSYPKLILISSVLSEVDSSRLSYITALYKVIKICRG
jgi:hypothetical protein